jgi:hypothetical protein
LVEQLPDCRVQGQRSVLGPLGQMQRVYCERCGKLEGLVSAEWTPHIFVICNACIEKHGGPPPLPELPQELITGGY